MMITPRAVSALLGSQPRPSMIAGISVRHSAASTGPTSPPTPPVRATPPSTTAATLFSVAFVPIVARGSPPPVEAVTTRPANPANSPPIA